jgi:hypothetical protein
VPCRLFRKKWAQDNIHGICLVQLNTIKKHVSLDSLYSGTVWRREPLENKPEASEVEPTCSVSHIDFRVVPFEGEDFWGSVGKFEKYVNMVCY